MFLPKLRLLQEQNTVRVGALTYNSPAKSVQFHPEYTEAHLWKMFEQSVNHFLTSEEAEAAIASFKNVNFDKGSFTTGDAFFF